MLHNFLIVLQQVIVLFILILIGYFCGKRRIFSAETIRGLDFLVLNMALPCTIVRGFQMEHTAEMMRNLLLCIVFAALLQILFLFVSMPFAKKLPRDERAVYALSSALTNCSFMGFPLQNAVLGSIGVLYGSGYVFSMNLFTFTVGYYLFTGDRKSISPKQIITRPAIVGTVLGLILFVMGISLPSTVSTVVDHIANLAVPLPMFIIGYHLSNVELKTVLRNRLHWRFSVLRLIVLPIAAIALLYALGLRGTVLLSLSISASCPTATAVTIIASRFSEKGELSAELGAMQTILSLLTLPVMLAFASLFA